MITTGHVDDQRATGTHKAIISKDDILALQQAAADIVVDPQVLEYAVSLVRATRDSASVSVGAGPRASIALIRAARAKALINSVGYVVPQDVKTMALPVMRHRIKLSPDMEIEGLSEDQILTQIIETVDAPRV